MNPIRASGIFIQILAVLMCGLNIADFFFQDGTTSRRPQISMELNKFRARFNINIVQKRLLIHLSLRGQNNNNNNSNYSNFLW